MTEQNSGKEKFIFRIQYPWRTLLAVILLLFYALLLLSPQLVDILKIPPRFLHPFYFIAAFTGFLLLAWFDIKRFFRQQRLVRDSMQQLWSSKRHLQERAQTSASHTDKLKLFISDKLLEYIEYDEKYLHFKSIASEVRHNGVISFDKVQSALTYAQSHSLPDQSSDTSVNARMYQEALSGMRYLWDLLDLSTTDNMALHIGAHISRCEELLFQAELQGSEPASMPEVPTFDPRQALLDTLVLHLGVTLCDENGNPEPQVLFSADNNQALILTDADGLYRIEIQPCEHLLGSANHLILLLENLIKNAQFFATKRQYKSPFAPISVRLWEAQQCLCMTIYNRGPHIDYDQKDQIFKLGFSTRRVQEHHGKGLGLYFVHQITQGFDGDIGFDNIHTPDSQYSLRLELTSGDIQNIHLDVMQDDKQVPRVCISGSEENLAKWLDIPLHEPLKSIELSGRDDQQVYRFDVESPRQTIFDPQNPAHPQWMIRISGRKGDQLTFTPLDIRGVQFSLRLPTVSGRIDGVSAQVSGPELEALEAGFRSPDDF